MSSDRSQKIYSNTAVKEHSECSHRFHFSNNDKVKQRNDRCQIFHFDSSEVKQGSERSQRFHFNSSQVKQHSECSEIFHFNNSGEVKQRSEVSQKFV